MIPSQYRHGALQSVVVQAVRTVTTGSFLLLRNRLGSVRRATLRFVMVVRGGIRAAIGPFAALTVAAVDACHQPYSACPEGCLVATPPARFEIPCEHTDLIGVDLSGACKPSSSPENPVGRGHV